MLALPGIQEVLYYEPEARGERGCMVGSKIHPSVVTNVRIGSVV